MGGSVAVAALQVRETDRDLNDSFQERVNAWLVSCFGDDAAYDRLDRTHRFLEEALELAQAGGCTREDALALLNYVFSRPIGDVTRETGGVMVTLAGMAHAHNVDIEAAGEAELDRNHRRTLAIREKRSRKPPNSPLPQ